MRVLEPIIRINNLTHTYSINTPFERTALDAINLDIYQGEYLGIIGQTGSGKSTLIQHLNGLLKPTSGSILFDGQDIWSSPALQRNIRFQVGLVFQFPEYQLFEETVYKDIAFGPRNMGLTDEEIDSRIRRSMQFVGLSEELLDRSPFDLSGGQKRRVAIAGVIAMEPKVLILDEPTAGLDPASVESLLENINTYHESNDATVIVVSHSMEEIARTADRMVVFREGKIPLSGTAQEVFIHSEMLTKMGLGVPQITSVFSHLYKMGAPVDPAVYTVAQAKDSFLTALANQREAE